MFRSAMIVLFCWAFLWAEAGENSFYFKDGRSEKGQILAEFENHFLVKTPDGKIVEIAKSDLARMIQSNGKILKAKDILAGKSKSSAVDVPSTTQEEKAPITEIDVTTKPESADVAIDGEKKGISPLRGIALEPGEHLITVSRNGFEPQKRKIKIKAGKKDAVRFKLKEDKPAAVEKKEPVPELEAESFLDVTTKPESAHVWIDGKEKGFSPLKQIAVAPGEHLVIVRRDGFIEAEKKVAIKQGKDAKLQFKLKQAPKPEAPKDSLDTQIAKEPLQEPAAMASLPAPNAPSSSLPALNGYLTVSSKPTGALVLLDGVKAGITPLNSLAEEGPHQVKLTLEGYTDASYPVNIVGGKTAKLNVKLYPSDAAPEQERSTSVGLSIFRWSIGAVALAALPACGYYAWKAETDFKEYENPNTDPSHLGTLHSQIREEEQRALILGGAGAGALAVFGITFFF